MKFFKNFECLAFELIHGFELEAKVPNEARVDGVVIGRLRCEQAFRFTAMRSDAVATNISMIFKNDIQNCQP